MELNLFDIVVITITLLLGIKGFFVGIVREIAGLAGMVLGLYFASHYYEKAGLYINKNLMEIPNESAITLVGFVTVFISIWLVTVFLGLIISKLLKVAFLGVFDRIGGFIFSAGKFFVLVAIFITLISKVDYLDKKMQEYTKNSLVFDTMKTLGEKIIKLDPEKISKEVKDVQKSIESNVKKATEEGISKSVEKTIEKAKKELSEAIDTNESK